MPVEAIEFNATFPVATLKYQDSLLPVTIESTMFSPITPHDAKTSGTPGFNAVFRIKNRSDKRVEVSLLSNLKNPLATGAEDRKLTNKVTKAGETTYLTNHHHCRDAPNGNRREPLPVGQRRRGQLCRRGLFAVPVDRRPGFWRAFRQRRGVHSLDFPSGGKAAQSGRGRRARRRD